MNEDLTKNLSQSSDGRLDELVQIIQSVRTELNELRNTVETRLYDTRPNWDRLNGDVEGLKQGQETLKQGQDLMRTDVREIRTHLRDMDRRLSIFNDTLVGIQADYRDIYDRVREIERQRT